MADYVGQPWIICRGGGQQLAPESPTERVYICVCVCVCERVCRVPLQPSGEAPLQFIPANYSMGNLLVSPSMPLLPLRLPIPYVTAPRCLCERRGQNRGHQLVLPHGVTWAMNRGTPEPSTHIISVFPLEAALSSPHRFNLVFREVSLLI